jgi:hypothetical protein
MTSTAAPTAPRSRWRDLSLGRAILILALALAAGRCTAQTRAEPETERGAVVSIDTVLARHTDEWLAIPGVVGTGLGECEGTRCITIFVIEQSEEIRRRIPSSVEGHPVSIVVSGEVRPRS